MILPSSWQLFFPGAVAATSPRLDNRAKWPLLVADGIAMICYAFNISTKGIVRTLLNGNLYLGRFELSQESPRALSPVGNISRTPEEGFRALNPKSPAFAVVPSLKVPGSIITFWNSSPTDKIFTSQPISIELN